MRLFLTIILGLNLNIVLAHEKTFFGDKVKIGDGYARSYIKMHYKIPKEIGVIISENGLNNLPHEMIEYTLPMPAKVSVYPYKQMTLDWNPHGHEPMGVYDKPHFDFHFYFISIEDRQKITCIDEDAAFCMTIPAPEYLASDYSPTPGGVTMMGWHWVDLLSPEFNGGIFTRTFIYGYYGGKNIFIEPMVTLEYLQSQETSLLDVRRPQVFPYIGGHFPKKYKVYFDEGLRVHKVVLKNFTKNKR